MSKKKKQKDIKPPESLMDIFKLVLKNLPKTLLWRIPLLLILVPLIFILHTFLLVYCNEGFNGGQSWILDNILCLRGRTVSSMLFWFMLATILPAVIKGMWKARGPFKYIGGIFKKLGDVISSFKTAENEHMPYLLGGIAGVCFIVWIWQNTFVNIMILLFILRGLLILSAGSFLYILARCAQNDFRRFFIKDKNKQNTQLSIEQTFYIYSGIAIALIIASIPNISNYTSLIGIIAAIFIFINIKKYRPGTVANLMIFWGINGIILFLISQNLIADDGGWQESGGTFDRWINSEGAVIAMLRGIPPTASVIGGTLLGGAVENTISAISNIPPMTPVTTSTLPDSNDIPLQDSNDGWVYSDEYGREIPTEGARDAQGRIYKKVPWDESGYAFVDPEEAKELDAMNSSGKIWDRNYGYISPEEAAARNAQREASWEDFKKDGIKDLTALRDSDTRLQALKKMAKIQDMQHLANKARNNWSDLTSQERDILKDYSKNASEEFKRYVRGEPVTIPTEIPGSYEGTVKALNVIKFATDVAAACVADVAKATPGLQGLGYGFEYGYITLTEGSGQMSQAISDYMHGKGPKTLTGAIYRGINNGGKAIVFSSVMNLAMDKGGGKILNKLGFTKILGKTSGEVLHTTASNISKRIFKTSIKAGEDSAVSIGQHILKKEGITSTKYINFYKKLCNNVIERNTQHETAETVIKSSIKKVVQYPVDNYVFNPIKGNVTK